MALDLGVMPSPPFLAELATYTEVENSSVFHHWNRSQTSLLSSEENLALDRKEGSRRPGVTQYLQLWPRAETLRRAIVLRRRWQWLADATALVDEPSPWWTRDLSRTTPVRRGQIPGSAYVPEGNLQRHLSSASPASRTWCVLAHTLICKKQIWKPDYIYLL